MTRERVAEEEAAEDLVISCSTSGWQHTSEMLEGQAKKNGNDEKKREEKEREREERER